MANTKTAILIHMTQEELSVFLIDDPTAQETRVLKTANGIWFNSDDASDSQWTAYNKIYAAIAMKAKYADESVPKKWHCRWRKFLADDKKIHSLSNHVDIYNVKYTL